MNKINVFLICTFTIILIVYVWIKMRKEIPYHEFISVDSGITIVNTRRWNLDKLEILLNGKYKHRFNRHGLCVFHNLNNNTPYTVEVRRTDLKGFVLYKKLIKKITPVSGGIDYYVLVGASVGRDWNFQSLPVNLAFNDKVVFGYRGAYQFDKSIEIKKLLDSGAPVSSIIIKECAAYFPRDLEASKKDVFRWIALIRKHGVEPILATVVPVTSARAAINPEQQAGILSYNDFIRSLAAQENIRVLDLEKAVRESSQDRFLRDVFAKEDGLHLKTIGYRSGLDLALADLGFIDNNGFPAMGNK